MSTKYFKRILAVVPLLFPFFVYADGLEDLIKGVQRIALGLIPIAALLALLFFFYGLANFLRSGGEKDAEKGRSLIIWGIVALFVLFSVWGIIKFAQSELGLGGVFSFGSTGITTGSLSSFTSNTSSTLGGSTSGTFSTTGGSGSMGGSGINSSGIPSSGSGGLTVGGSGHQATYRYIKWEITQKKGEENCSGAACVQASEFVLLFNGTSVHWPNGTTVINPSGHTSPSETPSNIIDGLVSTKWLDWNFSLGDPHAVKGDSVLVIDTGSGNHVTFDAYKWSTANDQPQKDPVSWSVYASNDGSNWMLLDSRVDESIIDSRYTYTSDYKI